MWIRYTTKLFLLNIMPLSNDLGGMVAQWTYDQEAVSSISGLMQLCNDSGQVVHTYVPLLPGSIILDRHNMYRHRVPDRWAHELKKLL